MSSGATEAGDGLAGSSALEPLSLCHAVTQSGEVSAWLHSETVSGVHDRVKLILLFLLFLAPTMPGDGSLGPHTCSASAPPQSHTPSSLCYFFILSQGLIKLLRLALGSLHSRSPVLNS